MKHLYFCPRSFGSIVLAMLLFHAQSGALHAQPAPTTPSNFKIAFFGDQGLGTKSQDVLRLIKAEGANAVLHLGDFDYNDDPQGWDDQINGILGKDFPYFACIGNHDEDKFYGAGGYQELMAARMQRLGLTWRGDLGSQAYFKFHGILFVMTAPGVSGSGHEAYINDVLEADSSIWRVSSWHKNMQLMQVGNKTNETGWGVYEESRKGGAIIATGHEHSYSRTHLLSNCQNQIIASASDTLVLTRDQAGTPEDEGRAFVFVSGLGGKSIRSQTLDGDWWASIYSSTQKATYGALFGIFNYNGIPNLAKFYFKAINGAMPDSFFVISKVAPPPGIATFTPARGPVGTPITITGSNFIGATQVAFNGVAATSFTINSDTQIYAIVPAGALIGKISVTTPTGTTMSASDFAVTFPPSISAFAPLSGPAGTLVTIAGHHFTATTQVAFDSVMTTNFVIASDTLLRVIVPAGAATGKISVTTTDGSATSENDFVVTMPPRISAFAPISGPAGTLVTITGHHFTATTQVAFDSVMAPNFVIASDTLLRVTVPARAATGKISVTTTDGNATSENDFVVTMPPRISAFAPLSGPAGTLVTIAGRYFTATTQVAFDSVMTTNFVIASDTLLRATVPAGAITGKISVTTTDGNTTSEKDFVVTMPPSISAFAPISGPAGTLVTIAGRYFTATTQVAFDSVMAPNFVIASDTLLRAAVPSRATTGKISVTTPTGTTSSTSDFIVETATDVHNKNIETSSGPNDFVLEQNHPNPFNATTSIAFWVPKGMAITLKIYNITGQEVTTLANGFHPRGRYTITFEATDWLSGVYFIVLKAGNETRVRQIMLTK